jgi:hypothetical protein
MKKSTRKIKADEKQRKQAQQDCLDDLIYAMNLLDVLRFTAGKDFPLMLREARARLETVYREINTRGLGK